MPMYLKVVSHNKE